MRYCYFFTWSDTSPSRVRYNKSKDIYFGPRFIFHETRHVVCGPKDLPFIRFRRSRYCLEIIKLGKFNVYGTMGSLIKKEMEKTHESTRSN